MSGHKIVVIDKKAEEVTVFSVLTDAAEHANIKYKTLQYRLRGGITWWENNNFIIARAKHIKAQKKMGGFNK